MKVPPVLQATKGDSGATLGQVAQAEKIDNSNHQSEQTLQQPQPQSPTSPRGGYLEEENRG